VKKRLVDYLIVQDLNHPVVDRARALPEGWTEIKGAPAETTAIDYIRSNLFRPKDLKPLIHTKPGPNNDLFERVEDLLQRAINDDQAMVYAFGERWGPEATKKDQYLQFKPGNGVHLIHMNQSGSTRPASAPCRSLAHRPCLSCPSPTPAASRLGLSYLMIRPPIWRPSSPPGQPARQRPGP